MHSLHFLRPAWFLALLPLVALLVVWWRHRGAARSWQAVVDPGLLPHLLVGRGGGSGAWSLVAIIVGAVLAVAALAGPTWSKLQQPVFRREAALVVLLDLSRSMNAGDLQPSRLQMAKFKLRDILARRKEGETALVVYAADPFVVTPLTNDIDNIVRQLPGLTTDLMPAQGSRTDRALTKAQALLQQAGAVRGDVLLITDGIDNDPPAALHGAMQKLKAAGFRLSVLGVGTMDPAPIPLADGGFYKDASGAIVLPKLNEDALRKLATDGHGIYRRLAVGDGDTEALTAAFDRGWASHQSSQRVAGMKSDQWREAGPWLLLPLLPLAALAFRRGYLVMLCLLILLPVPRSANAFAWQDLWQRPDQRGAQALAAQHPEQAAKLFQDPRWRAAAHYRAGDYRAALKDLGRQSGAAVLYNRGNALAHLGRYQDALDAYNEALKRAPDLKDAAYNRDLVRKWLQSPPKGDGGAANKGRQQPAKKRQGGQQSKQPESGTQGNPAQANKSGQRNTSSGEDQAANAAQAQHGDNTSQSSSAQQQAGNAATEQGDNAAMADKVQDDQQNQRNATNDTHAPTAGVPRQSQSESEQATEQWLRRIPDDPGGLWRRKFLYQYKREYQSQQGEARPW